MAAAEWPDDGRIAVALTFDGALPEHLSVVVPQLRERGFRATFFVCPPGVLEDPRGWQALVDEGHELGDHTFFEVTMDGALPRWTLAMVSDDLELTHQFFHEVFPLVNPIAFAIPGMHPVCAEGSYLPALDRFTYLRGVETGSNGLAASPRSLAARSLFDSDPTSWRGPMEVLVASSVEPDLLAERLDLLRSERFWVAPFSEVAGRLRARQEVR